MNMGAIDWNRRLQDVLERTAPYDMSLMDAEQNKAYEERLELNRIALEMSEAKHEAYEFLKLAEQYKAEGEERGFRAAWLTHKLNMQRYHDLSLLYTKIKAAM